MQSTSPAPADDETVVEVITVGDGTIVVREFVSPATPTVPSPTDPFWLPLLVIVDVLDGVAVSHSVYGNGK